MFDSSGESSTIHFMNTFPLHTNIKQTFIGVVPPTNIYYLCTGKSNLGFGSIGLLRVLIISRFEASHSIPRVAIHCNTEETNSLIGLT